jgi:hypothetical protein
MWITPAGVAPATQAGGVIHIFYTNTVQDGSHSRHANNTEGCQNEQEETRVRDT